MKLLLLIAICEIIGDFISSIFNSKFVLTGITSWPLAVLIIAILFKPVISKVLSSRKVQIEAGGGNGVKVLVDGLIKTTKGSLEGTPDINKQDKDETDLPELTMLNNTVSLSVFPMMAYMNPANTIKNIWSMFDRDLYTIIDFLIQNKGLKFEGDTSHVMDVLKEENYISESTAQAVQNLYLLYQISEIENLEDKIDREEFANKAREYYTLCAVALEKFRSELSKHF